MSPIDLERYKAIVSSTIEKSKLLNMRNNAFRKEAAEYVNIVEAQLDARFSDWRKPKHGKGADPTFARFGAEERHFPSQVQAYLWLVEQIVISRPEVLGAQDWRAEFVSKGRAGHFFARDPRKLWDRSAHLVEDPSYYARLSNGWFASTNLSKHQKLSIIYRLAEAAKLLYSDWEFRGENEKMPSLEDLEKLLDLL